MKPLTSNTFTPRSLAAPALAALLALPACAVAQPPAPTAEPVIESPRGTPRPPFTFSSEDNKFLDEIEKSCFDYFWNAGVKPSNMVPDRTSGPVISVAGVGFQLSALCIGAERGWITKDQGAQRAMQLLTPLRDSQTIRKAGMFYHFISADGKQPEQAYEHVVSTIDSALLFSGMLTASAYFGGDVQKTADDLFAAADWRFFIMGDHAGKPYEGAFLSLAWKPADVTKPDGAGKLVPYSWIDSGDEHRLVTFLSVCAPKEEHRINPRLYYMLRRTLGEDPATGPMVYLPWSGAIFTNIFANCWINYSALGPDHPEMFHVEHRPRVDWWENARREVKLHQRKCAENPKGYQGLGEYGWALTASDRERAYQVPGVFPKLMKPAPAGWLAEIDYARFMPEDDFGDGTIAPYGPGSTIMFEPTAAVKALRTMRGMPLAWGEPAKGGWGFRSFNPNTGWSDPDVLPIEHGPLLLAIENARTGLVWRVFHGHPWVKAGMTRLGLKEQK